MADTLDKSIKGDFYCMNIITGTEYFMATLNRETRSRKAGYVMCVSGPSRAHNVHTGPHSNPFSIMFQIGSCSKMTLDSIGNG